MHATISLLVTLLPVAVLGEGKFSFDPAAADGPQNWATLDIENNQCGGNAQSGINIPTGPCDELMADYTFNVSVLFSCLLDLTVRGFSCFVRFD
jgi:carbonic anhydrase